MIRFVTVLLGTFLAIWPACVSPAFAHAFLDRASPSAGAEMRASPPAVTITFTEGVEVHFSTIEVLNANGVRVDSGDVHCAGPAEVLTVGLPKLPPGDYSVVWHVTSVDTHRTEGKYSFTVLP